MEKQKKLTDMFKKEVINPIRAFSKNYKPSLTDYLICGGFAVAVNIFGFLGPESKEVLDKINQMGHSSIGGYAVLSYFYTITSAFVSIPLASTIEFIRHYDKYKTLQYADNTILRGG